MDMNVSEFVLANRDSTTARFKLIGRDLGDRLVLVLSDRHNNHGFLPTYIAVNTENTPTSAGLIPVAALVIMCDWDEQARSIMNYSGGGPGTVMRPTLHCPNNDSYLRPADLAHYRPFLDGLVR